MKFNIYSLIVCLGFAGCVAGPDEIEAKKETSVPVKAAAAANPGINRDAPEPRISKSGYQTTASGLKFIIHDEGSGTRPKATSHVVAHYRGTLDNGKEFDSSFSGDPIPFPLNGVIKGWTEGLQLIKEGGEIELLIPSQLAYGPSGFPPAIPPNAQLHFQIKLISVR